MKSSVVFPFLYLFAGLLIAAPADQATPLLAEALGGPDFESWQGGTPSDGVLSLHVPGTATWQHPAGPLGVVRHGFRVENDGVSDWSRFYGMQFEVLIAGGAGAELQVTLTEFGKNGSGRHVTAPAALQGGGWKTVTLPWEAFEIPAASRSFLQAVREVRIGVAGPAKTVSLRNVRAIKAPAVSLESDIRGKAAAAGSTAEYSVQVGNTSLEPQAVVLALAPYGWEAMVASIEPKRLTLAAGEVKEVKLHVAIPANIPPGGHEIQTLVATANGDAAQSTRLTFTTASQLPHPNILLTPARREEIRAKVKNLAWAKKAQDDIVAKAEKWAVPEIAQPPKNDPDDTYGPFVFPTTTEHDVMAAGVAWQLTGNRVFAEKVATYLRRLSDPAQGYPKTLRGCNQGLVQEGHYFQHMAMAYDMILDSGVLGDADRAQIERTFRLLMDGMDRANSNGAINNWNVSEITGSLYCSLALQDLERAQRFYAGPGALRDQLAKGVMDDGWWYECSISYNTWVASEFSQAALALQPWGINFKDAWLPASYSPTAALTTELSGGGAVQQGSEQTANRPFGMAPEIWGPIARPYRTITDMWNSLLPFLDYRGVMFGVNDSTENLIVGPRAEIGGSPFELAYYLFRDPAYASLVKLASARDLLYGVPELPPQTPERFRDSAYADNVGVAMLRSQTPDRPIREQIQAVLHYGTHGWAHGHFDRTNLLSLMRYGRSFYNPEMIWYSYEPFMYKFYVQTSESHNMVVVDRKNQEAMPGQRQLFYSGKAMQAAMVETTARWSRPPYGGMVYDYVPVKTFAEKTWREGRSVQIPADPPAYGTLTDYSEPILQRRLMVVTDDYVVLADYLKGEQPHTYENLFQMKGFQGLEAPAKKLLKHDGQWDADPTKSAQFVTDCDWYGVNAPATSHFQMQFGPGADNAGTRAPASEDGVLKLDVHSLWPARQEIMVGAAPEDHAVEKRLFYKVGGDGKTLAEGKFGAWILGQGDIDVLLEGVKQLELETKVELSKKPTIFWGNARVVTRDGKEIPLGDLAPQFQNVAQPPQAGKDYEGGPIKIVGHEQKTSLPGEPADVKQAGLVRIDLAGRDAVRLVATIGSDYPLGNEAQRRKTYAIKAAGAQTKEARFLTIIEPFEKDAMIVKAEALGANQLRVELKDGRVQEIAIRNLEGDGKSAAISLRETKNGALTRTEETPVSIP